MKKLVIVAALMGAASLSFGQGIVSFANGTTSRISTNNTANSGAGTSMAAAPVGTWYYALFRTGSANAAAPNTSIDPLTAGWTLVAVGTNTASAGRLNGNTTTEGVSTTASAPSTDDYAVAGWSSSMGTTWAQVEAFFNNNPNMTQQNASGNSASAASGQSFFWFGIAPTFADNIIAQPTGSAINGVFGSAAGLINGYSLTAFSVPEPSSCALIGIGSAALLIFRRRRK